MALCLSFYSHFALAQTLVETGEEPGATSVWSPDHQVLAHIEVAHLIGTPAGSNSCLYLNSRAVYPVAHPKNCEPHPRGIYDGIHTFLTPPEWSPDGHKVAIVTRIFDWEYLDPYGRYWEGTLSDDRYYLVIASVDQPAVGYRLKPPTDPALRPIGPLYYATEKPLPILNLKWAGNSELSVNGQMFDIGAQPPTSVP